MQSRKQYVQVPGTEFYVVSDHLQQVLYLNSKLDYWALKVFLVKVNICDPSVTPHPPLHSPMRGALVA